LSTAELSFEIDVLTLPKTKAKNELLLVAVEVGTGWIEAWKIPDSTSTTICNTLIEHLISRFGIPASIKCDRAPSFLANLTKQLAKALGVKFIYNSTHKATASAKCERSNALLINSLKMILQDFEGEWNEVLPSHF